MYASTSRGKSIANLTSADLNEEGKALLLEGGNPSVAHVNGANRAILENSDIVVLHDRGLATVLLSKYPDSETDEILGIRL